MMYDFDGKIAKLKSEIDELEKASSLIKRLLEETDTCIYFSEEEGELLKKFIPRAQHIYGERVGSFGVDCCYSVCRSKVDGLHIVFVGHIHF